MKAIITMMFIGLFMCQSLSQNQLDTNLRLANLFVGKWEHVSSTFPNGDVKTYKQEIEFYKDGEGVCTKISLTDTIKIDFQWEILDSAICLFTLDKKGNRILADKQYISDIDFWNFYLSDLYDEHQSGKVCFYRRSEYDIAKY